MANKPLFVFFKMNGCGHCVTFFNQTWPLLIKDSELRNSVEFVMYEWGRGSDGQTFQQLPEEYKDRVKYGLF